MRRHSGGRGSRSLASFAWAELRARRGRAVALGAGILVAAVCFGLLSSETATSKLQVTDTVKQNFRSAYDILVRPKGAQTPFEKARHVVDDGFLSGLFGGITMKQYREIKSLPGVSLAAPVANVGYFMMSEAFFVPFPKSVTRTAHEVLRVGTTWNLHDGLEHIPGIPFYLYYTNGRLTFATADYQHGTESVPGAPRPVDVCEGFYAGQYANQFKPSTGGASANHQVLNLNPKIKNPFRALDQGGNFACSARHMVYSAANRRLLGADGTHYQGPAPFGAVVMFEIPVLVAGIDPDAENQLVGLKSAMVSGRYLQEGEGLSAPVQLTHNSVWKREYPLIASDQTYFDERADVTIQRLHLPGWPRLAGLLSSSRAYGALTHADGTLIGRTQANATSASTGWQRLLGSFNRAEGEELTGFTGGYYRVSPTHDSVTPSGVIVPRPVRPNGRVWVTPVNGPLLGRHSEAPPGAADTWYRSVSAHYQTGGEHVVDGHVTDDVPLPRLTGTFDPARLRGFSPLSKVPLQTFYPPTVTAANAPARRRLGTTGLGPTMNPAGYLSQPPLLLTTIQGAIALENGDGETFVSRVTTRGSRGQQIKETFHGQAYQHVSPKAPISTIQVRVKGVTGPTKLSLARIKLVAENIARTTGLTVNITAGGSPTPETIRLAAGKFGEPPLTVHQGWVKEDVDSGIINALSSEDLALSLLVFVVCGLFVGSATAASVRQRRREIAILSTVGWRARSIFALVVGEAALIGLIAGLAGCALSVVLAAAGSLQIPDARLALVVPVTIALTVIAAAWPAWRAAHVPPMDALRDPVLSGAHTHRVRSATGLAMANLLRVPGRTLVAVVTLIIGVGAFALIIGVTLAFRGGVAGTLLGSVVSVSVRGVDLVSCVLVVLVGAAAVSDVLIVSLRERAAELATLRAVGWTERQIIALAAREGLALGVLGSLIGAVLGIAIVAVLGASTGSVLAAAAIAALGGVLVTTGALIVPLARLGRAALVDALASE